MIAKFTASEPRALFAVRAVASTGSSALLSSFLRETSRRFRAVSGKMIAVLAMALGLMKSGIAAPAQTLMPNWNQQSPANSPGQRYIHGMAYDAGHSQVVMFGGFGNGYLNDTWLYNGTTWSQATPVNSPSPRAAVEMAYDAAHSQVVLFGGLTSVSGRAGDTWLWDGTNWTQAAPANSPPARASASMVNVPGQGVLLFGGVSAAGGDLNDTWLWNGTNWTQLSPASSPSARADYGMAYYAPLGLVVLFGGDSNGTYLNDTWLWNGQTWSQLMAPTPPARYAQGMDYDAALGEIVMFGGYNGGFLNDTWTFGPTSSGTGWTLASSPVSPSGRYAPNGMVYDAAQSQIVLFGGLGGTQTNDTWAFALPGNFGNVNVCPSGQTTPAPCTSTVAFTYFFANGATLATTPKIVTQGTIGLDFTVGTGSTCSGTVAAGTCTVNVIFNPTAPGLRMGAIQLTSSTDIPQVTTPIYGIGQGPATAFGPATQSVVASGLGAPYAVATDAAGNTFISDVGTATVVKVAPGGAKTPVGFSLGRPAGVAVDGAGNVYIADQVRSAVTEVPAGCASVSCQISLPAPSGGGQPSAVAVDPAGDVFFTSYGLLSAALAQATKIPVGCTTTSCTTIVWIQPAGATSPKPDGIAVDAAGDVFIANGAAPATVVKIPAGCASASCQTTVGTGFEAPTGVAVDAAGDVFVSDANLGVFEVPPGCTNSSCQINLVSGIAPFGIAVDAQGNVIIPKGTGTTVTRLNRSQPPSLTFPPTAVSTVSSPQSVTLQNIGNQLLNAVSPGLVQVNGPNFVAVQGQGTLPDCPAFSTLPPGQACNLSISFAPTAGSNAFTSTALFSDNALNATTATQIIALSGSPLAPAFYGLNVITIGGGTGTVTDNSGQIVCSGSAVGTAGACSGNFPAGAQVTLTAVATGTSIFTGWGGACASAGANPTCSATINQAATATTSFVEQNFGSYNVCPAGQPTAGPCSNLLPVTFNLATTTNIGAIKVVTQGATGLDFTQGNGSTCGGTVQGGNSCVVNVNFKPTAPGLRMGAVQMFDSNGDLLSSAPIFGVGQGPAIAYGPGTQTVLLANLATRAAGVAVDAGGDVFVAGGLGATKLTPSGVLSTLPASGIGASGFYDVAVDGAGNVYLADSSNNRVVEVTPGGVQTTVPTTGLSFPSGVKVDGSGNLFITDRDNNRVVKITPGGVQTTVPATGLVRPYYPAVDAAGDVFFLDNGSQRILKVTPAGVQSTVPFTGLVATNGLAVDAAGDVFVSDQILNKVFQITPGGVQTTLASSSLITPAGLAVDAAGNLFIAVNGLSQVVVVARSQTPSLSFAQTNVGSTSSQQSFSLQNVGNQPLTGSLALNLGGNFSQNASTDCSTAFPLAPGASCGESFSFTPQSATFLSGAAVFSDNNFNGAPATQTIALSGTGATNGIAGTVAVPDVVGQVQSAATSPITSVGLAMGTVSTASSSTVPSGSIISQSPAAGTKVAVGTAVNLLVSSGIAQPNAPNPLSLANNYFVTGDYVAAGVSLRGKGVAGTATGTIVIPSYTQSATNGVPDGADVVDAYLYWETLENTPFASSTTGNFNGYPIVGQQIGNDLPNYVDGASTGTIRAYRAAVNAYLPVGANGIRIVSGNYTVSLPDGGSALPLTEGASLVMVYRVLSPNFPLKSVVLYDGSAALTAAGTQVVQGFYDAVGGANGTGKNTNLFVSGSVWNSATTSVTLGQSNQYSAPLNPASAYAAVILSTPVNNSDNDGILDAWKTGPTGGDFHAGQPGYYDAKTATWVGLPGAKHGQKDLFVQLDYMCGAVLTDGSCDPTKENLFPAPDVNGNDPLALVKQAFANSGVQLHLQIGNAVPEDTCLDGSSTQLCQFPGQPGVVGWKNSLEFSKLYPRNLLACLSGGDCTTRFPYGQKDSFHYLLMGHSLAIPAYNTRYGSLTSINVVNGITTIGTVDRGTGINACPSRVTLGGVLGNPSLNGVYNTITPCVDAKTITFATPGVPNYTYPNNILPEPVIGLTSGTVTSISGYSDLGGADSAVTLGLWLTAPNQDMSRKANVVAGTIFHEIGHTLGLGHGGIYYDKPNSYVPTFDANCKPNYQSVMNYLFQLDLLGPNQTLAFSNQTLNTLNENTAGSVTTLTDTSGNSATFPTSSWYVPYTTGSTATPATRHCDGTPLSGPQAYRVDAPIAPVSPPWTDGQDLNFIGTLQTQERGFNDLTNMDLRQLGATGGAFASLASVLSFGSSVVPLNVGANGNVTLGSGGTVALGSGGTVTLGSGGNVTLGSGGTITLGSGGNVTLGSGGNVTLGSGGTVTPGSGGTIALGSGGNVTLGSGGTITLGSGGNVILGSGGNVTLGSGGTITLGSGGTVTIPAAGGSYSIDSKGGTIALGSGGNVTLGSGGNVTLGSGGTIALGSGGNVTLGSGGNVTLGSGGTIALGSGGNITLGSGGNVTLGSGGTIALGSGGTVTLGSGGNVTLGSGGTVTLGSGGNVALGSGGNVTLGSGGSATLAAGGTVTLGSGGNVTLGSGGNVTLGSGGTIALGSGGNITLGSGGNVTLGSGGTIALGSGGTVTLGSGGTVTLDSGGTITLGSGGAPIPISAGGTYTFGGGGGTVTLGSGGNVTLGSGGNITLGSGGILTQGAGGTVTLGSGGNVVLGSGGNITLGSGGNVTLGSGGTITLGSGGNVILGSGGVVTLGTGGSVNQGIGSSISLGSVSNITPASGGPSAANELTYETANSVVRPPIAPVETSTPDGVRVTWNAPLFGVVQTYTIYRSSDGATPIVIGSVSGINGNPPATEFTDTNPDLTSQTVVYTISTVLVPDTTGAAPRQSVPSPPAVLKNDQSITLGPLPSSVIVTSPPTVTATALSGGVPNGLQVLFSATGACAIASQSISSNISSAVVGLTGTGSCTVTASQPGTTSFNAANSVSGTFTVLPLGSGTKSQTINFPFLPNAQYGNSFSLSATSTSGAAVRFSASGPCTTAGGISGVGVCNITASAAGNNTYSAASLTQSFTIYPAVLKVTANSLTSLYGQALPSLTYGYSGFVNSDPATVVIGAPALSTTATSTSAPGSYPITVSTGTLAAANYSFLYVTGTLTVRPANQSALTLNTSSPLMLNRSETLSVSGGTTGGPVTYNLISGACTITGTQLTANSGTGICLVTATMAGNSNYNAVTSSPANTVTLSPSPTQTITFTANPPVSAVYGTSFTVAATGGASGNAVTFSSGGACSNVGATYKMTSGTGTCSVIANQAGNSSYPAAMQITKFVNATLAAPNVTFTGAPASAGYRTVFTVATTTNASTAAVITSSGSCSNSGTAVTMTSGTGTCSLTATWIADGNYSGTTATQSTAATLLPQTITFTTNPPLTALYASSFAVAATGGASGTPVTFTSAGACSNSGATYTITGSEGTCSVIANQAGNSSYAAAAPVTKTVTAIGPLLTVSPSTINFGTVYQGNITARTVTVTNIGTAPATINDPLISFVKGGNSSEFVAINLCPRPLAAGKSCTILIGFIAGPYYTPQTATFQIVSNAPGSPMQVALSGLVINPRVSFNPTSLNFGIIRHATSSTMNMTLSNPGGTTLTLAGISVTGVNATSFIQTSTCGNSLAAGASCTVAVKFTPPAAGTFSANLAVVDNSQIGGGTQTVPLSGKGN